jgi:IS5 family transposase
MLKKTTPAPSFAETMMEKRLNHDAPLLQVLRAVDWRPLERKLEKLYFADAGRPAYPPLALFRVLLLQRFYNLSDPAVVEQLRHNYLFLKFTGLSVEDAPPDDTTLVVFRRRLAESGVEEWAFRHFTKQMEKRGLLVKEGTLIDAEPALSEAEGVVEAAVNRKAKRRDGNPHAGDAEWGRKSEKAKPVFGYKAHAAVDKGSHLIREVKVTDASVHDSQVFEELCAEETRAVYADKAYDSKARRRTLRARGVAARILFKAGRNRPLTRRQRKCNAEWSRVRAKVEAAFASMKRWCGVPRIRYLGMDGARIQVYFAALAHNLKRMTKLEGVKAGVCA